MSYTVCKDDRWFEFAAIHLEWLNPRPNLDVPAYIDDVISDVEKSGADTLAHCVDFGGYAHFPNSVIPLDEHLGGADLIGPLVQKVHDRGMKFIAAVYGCLGNLYLQKEYPQWRQIDISGRTIGAFSYETICINSPYRELLVQMLAELLSRYPIDGVYFEGSRIKTGSCFCEFCREVYKSNYGHEMPRREEELDDNEEYNQFRLWSFTDLVRRIHACIRDTSPQTAFFPCAYYPDSADIGGITPYCDAVAMERQWGYRESQGGIRDLFETGVHTRMVKARSRGKAIIETQHAHKQVDCDYSPRTWPHLDLTMKSVLMYKATPQVHIQTYFQTEPSRISDIGRIYSETKELRVSMAESCLAFQVGILDPDNASEAWRAIGDSFLGMFQALIESHMLCDVVSSCDIAGSRLIPVVVVPDVPRMSDACIEALSAYVERGGSLVLTGRSGLFNERGARRSLDGLSSLLGIDYPKLITRTSWSRDGHCYVRPEKNNRLGLSERLYSFAGVDEMMEVSAREGSVVEAYTYDFDYSRAHPSHHQVIGWYPGRVRSPLIVTTEKGRGKTAYISSGLETALYATGDSDPLELLCKTVAWAVGSRFPIAFDMPSGVEASIHWNERSRTLVIFLVNRFMNQTHGPRIIREVAPLHDLSITLHGVRASGEVRSLSGQSVDQSDVAGNLVLRIGGLTTSEVLILDLDREVEGLVSLR